MNNNKEKSMAKSVSYSRMSTKNRKIFNAVLIVIFILIFAGVNVLAMALVDKFPNLERDWTSSGAYSLNSTTKEYMKYLDKDVNIKVLLDEDEIIAIDSAYGYQVTRLLREMSTYDKINLEYLDIISTSVTAMDEKYPDIDWTSADNFLIIEDAETGEYAGLGIYDIFAQTYDSSYNVIIGAQYLEQSVLTTIQQVIADEIFKVGLSTGNGEFFNQNSAYYSYCYYIPYFLRDNAYEVEEINLLTETPSEELDVIIMMAPSVDLTADEVDALSKWLTNSGDYGKTLFYVPYDQAGDMPNLDLFLEQWGMKVTTGYISENDLSKAMSLGSNASNLFPLMDYYDDTYTEGLQTTYLSVLMPYCVPVEILDEESVTPLLVSSTQADIIVPSTSDESSAETIASDGEPVVGAAISTKTNDDDETSQVVVWGSYDALKNDWTYSTYSGNVNNITYFINFLNILTDNDAIILVESTDLGADYLLVTSGQKVTIGIIFIFIIPVAVFALGIVVWNRRRHR